MTIQVTERPWYSLMWFTDPHVHSTNPIARRDNYPEAILGKIGQIVTACEKLKVDQLLCGGDVWHSKAPTKTHHWTISRLIELWKRVTPYGIIGNHDMPWNNKRHMDRQPLGVLIKANVYDVADEDNPKKVGPFKIKGINFKSEINEREFMIDGLEKDEIGVLLLHVNASYDGSGFPGGEITYSYKYLASVTNAKIICIGHWHKDQGIQEVDGKHFINIGNIARNSLRMDNLGKQPKCCLIRANAETNEVQFDQIVLKHEPDEVVFDIAAKKLEVSQHLDVKNFLDKLRTGGLFHIDPEQMIKEADVPQEVKDKAIEVYAKAQN